MTNPPGHSANAAFPPDPTRRAAGGVRGTASIAFLGDLMLGGKLNEVLQKRPGDWVWGDVQPLLRGCDAVLGNLEAPLTARGRPWRKTWKAFHYRASPQALEVLRSGNLRCLALANNHILDYGAVGLSDTVALLDGAGIGHAGAGATLAAAAQPAVVDLPGLRIGVIAATDQMRSFRADPRGAGTYYLRVAGDSSDLAGIAAAAARLRAGGCDTVVLSLHWGPNMRQRPRARFRQFARQAIESGIDIVHGHSAHVFQGVECHRGGIILYDTGNFVDDYLNFWNFAGNWNFPFRHDDWSFVFLLDLQAGRPRRLRLLPVRTRPWPLRRAAGRDFEAIVGRMEVLSRSFGGTLWRTREGLEMSVDRIDDAVGENVFVQNNDQNWQRDLQ